MLKTLRRKLTVCMVILFTKNDYTLADGSISDGYHSFKELYQHRMLYNAAFAKLAKTQSDIRVFKSYKHSDGEPCFGGGWFIVTIQLPTGQISNHYRVRYWKLFDIPYVPFAPKWDGHDTKIAMERIREYVLMDDMPPKRSN